MPLERNSGVLKILDQNIAAVKWSKNTFFVKELELVGFLVEKTGTIPVELKVGSIMKMKQPENITDIRSLIQSLIIYQSKFV